MINKLEIHHFRTLDALYKFKNTTRAAESLNISQQAISLQLKKVREILHDNLFVRSGHGLSPTPYAKMIEPLIQNILIQIHQIPLPESVAPETIERTLCLSATDYTQHVIISKLAEKLHQLSPNVKIIVTNIEVANLTKLMNQGDVDLAFTSHGYVPEGLISESLFTEQYRCVASNKLTSQSDVVSLEQLTQFDFIVTNPLGGSLKGSADNWLERQGYPRKVVMSSPTFHHTLQFIKHRDLIGFIPSRLLPYEGVVDIPLEKYPPGYEVVMAYHPTAKNDPYMKWLIILLKQLFQSL